MLFVFVVVVVVCLFMCWCIQSVNSNNAESAFSASILYECTAFFVVVVVVVVAVAFSLLSQAKHTIYSTYLCVFVAGIVWFATTTYYCNIFVLLGGFYY